VGGPLTVTGISNGGEDEVNDAIGIMLGTLAMNMGERDVNNMLRMLRDSRFNLTKFLNTDGSASECKKVMQSRVHIDMQNCGLSRRKVIDPESLLECYVYGRSRSDVLKGQIGKSRARTTFYRPMIQQRSRGERCYSHPMAAQLGHIGGKAAEKAVRMSPKPDLVSMELAKDGMESFVGLGNLCSKNSNTTVKASAFTFYPLHLVLNNFD